MAELEVYPFYIVEEPGPSKKPDKIVFSQHSKVSVEQKSTKTKVFSPENPFLNWDPDKINPLTGKPLKEGLFLHNTDNWMVGKIGENPLEGMQFEGAPFFTRPDRGFLLNIEKSEQRNATVLDLHSLLTGTSSFPFANQKQEELVKEKITEFFKTSLGALIDNESEQNKRLEKQAEPLSGVSSKGSLEKRAWKRLATKGKILLMNEATLKGSSFLLDYFFDWKPAIDSSYIQHSPLPLAEESLKWLGGKAAALPLALMTSAAVAAGAAFSGEAIAVIVTAGVVLGILGSLVMEESVIPHVMPLLERCWNGTLGGAQQLSWDSFMSECVNPPLELIFERQVLRAAQDVQQAQGLQLLYQSNGAGFFNP